MTARADEAREAELAVIRKETKAAAIPRRDQLPDVAFGKGGSDEGRPLSGTVQVAGDEADPSPQHGAVLEWHCRAHTARWDCKWYFNRSEEWKSCMHQRQTVGSDRVQAREDVFPELSTGNVTMAELAECLAGTEESTGVFLDEQSRDGRGGSRIPDLKRNADPHACRDEGLTPREGPIPRRINDVTHCRGGFAEKLDAQPTLTDGGCEDNRILAVRSKSPLEFPGQTVAAEESASKGGRGGAALGSELAVAAACIPRQLSNSQVFILRTQPDAVRIRDLQHGVAGEKSAAGRTSTLPPDVNEGLSFTRSQVDTKSEESESVKDDADQLRQLRKKISWPIKISHNSKVVSPTDGFDPWGKANFITCTSVHDALSGGGSLDMLKSNSEKGSEKDVSEAVTWENVGRARKGPVREGDTVAKECDNVLRNAQSGKGPLLLKTENQPSQVVMLWQNSVIREAIKEEIPACLIVRGLYIDKDNGNTASSRDGKVPGTTEGGQSKARVDTSTAPKLHRLVPRQNVASHSGAQVRMP
ncbi:unnamed protein product [Symbiodinium sp. CCMP2592]|nr:unnamed protein product [Symbiodinium sp. CCMP2592]